MKHGFEEFKPRIIYRCIIGSQAYGLADAESDVDRRGFFLPTAETHWSLAGAPESIENPSTQELYWELQKFLTLALKANPQVLECMFTPLVEVATPLAQELLDMRSAFLTRMAHATYSNYALSQFRKAQADMRNYGHVRWKHLMHLLRLLISGIGLMRDGIVPVRVDSYRDRLLAVRSGEMSWDDVERWRTELHVEFDSALRNTNLPQSPDYGRVDAFLIRARRLALDEKLP